MRAISPRECRDIVSDDTASAMGLPQYYYAGARQYNAPDDEDIGIAPRCFQHSIFNNEERYFL